MRFKTNAQLPVYTQTRPRPLMPGMLNAGPDCTAAQKPHARISPGHLSSTQYPPTCHLLIYMRRSCSYAPRHSPHPEGALGTHASTPIPHLQAKPGLNPLQDLQLFDTGGRLLTTTRLAAPVCDYRAMGWYTGSTRVAHLCSGAYQHCCGVCSLPAATRPQHRVRPQPIPSTPSLA